MKNLYTSLLLSIFPVYSFISWLIIFNNSLLIDHNERVLEFKKVIFYFNWDFKIMAGLEIILLILSMYFMFKFLKENPKLIYKAFTLFFMVFITLIGIFKFWELL